MPYLNQYSSGLTDDEVSKIIDVVGRERLSSYLKYTASDREALALYQVNGELSKHIHEVIGGFEVTLRNSVSTAISGHLERDDWYRCRPFLQKLEKSRRDNIREVRSRLTSDRREHTTGRVVAGLSFHFWVSMHEAKYRDFIWTPFLHKMWPPKSNLRRFHKDLLKTRDFRNRIAHYEPIINEKWHKRIDMIWERYAELAPEKAAWHQRRLSGSIASLRTMCMSRCTILPVTDDGN